MVVEGDDLAHESILDLQVPGVPLGEHNAVVLVDFLAPERDKSLGNLPGPEPLLLAEAINRPHLAIERGHDEDVPRGLPRNPATLLPELDNPGDGLVPRRGDVELPVGRVGDKGFFRLALRELDHGLLPPGLPLAVNFGELRDVRNPAANRAEGPARLDGLNLALVPGGNQFRPDPVDVVHEFGHELGRHHARLVEDDDVVLGEGEPTVLQPGEHHRERVALDARGPPQGVGRDPRDGTAEDGLPGPAPTRGGTPRGWWTWRSRQSRRGTRPGRPWWSARRWPLPAPG